MRFVKANAAKVKKPHRQDYGCLPGLVAVGRLEFCLYSSTLAPSARPRRMPTYEYSCEKCGKNFDVFQSMRDAAFTDCPQAHCQLEEWGRGRVKRLLGTGAGLIFKGSGFYITDYRSNSYRKRPRKMRLHPAPAGKRHHPATRPVAAQRRQPHPQRPSRRSRRRNDQARLS